MIGIVTVAFVAAFALVFTWWAGPIDSTGNRIGTANFAQRGIGGRSGSGSGSGEFVGAPGVQLRQN